MSKAKLTYKSNTTMTKPSNTKMSKSSKPKTKKSQSMDKLSTITNMGDNINMKELVLDPLKEPKKMKGRKKKVQELEI